MSRVSDTTEVQLKPRKIILGTSYVVFAFGACVCVSVFVLEFLGRVPSNSEGTRKNVEVSDSHGSHEQPPTGGR